MQRILRSHNRTMYGCVFDVFENNESYNGIASCHVSQDDMQIRFLKQYDP